MKNNLFISLLASSMFVLAACDKDDDGGGGNVTGVSGGSPGDGDDDGDGGGDEGDDSATGAGEDGGAGDDDSGASADDGASEGDSADDGAESGTEGGETGSTFISEPDGGAVNECDIWSQDCPESEKCMPWANDGGNSWNATKCSPVAASPKQEGDSCTPEGGGVSGVDDCDVASMCWDVDPESGMGTCVAFCTGSEAAPMCADPNQSCTIANDGVLILCLPGCDPLIQDCAEGNGCYPINDGFTCAPDASGPDAGVYQDPCEFINVCDPGLACINAESVPNCQGASGCCSPFCTLGDTDCPTDTLCEPWYEEGMAPPGFETVGICIIPGE
jgi:hypothetical protein